MSTVGPTLPRHLAAKRKREEDDAQDAVEAREPPRPSSRPGSPNSTGKRARVIGPSLPPAPLEERPTENPNSDEDSTSEDDIGPAPPSSADRAGSKEAKIDVLDHARSPETSVPLRREEWMLVPPKQDDWSSRVDPTKLRNRKFNTGTGAKAPAQKAQGDTALWTETPEQRQQRLADEVMGVRKPATDVSQGEKTGQNKAEEAATARRIREYNDKHRGRSLYNEHKEAGPKEKEDDPSKRAFDKEKDIRGGRKIGHAQRKELLNRAADFGSRFVSGSYM